ncbi:MAG: ATP-binding protein [Lachnospiraceae bacterium]|nr:ATP-binding protein [Lachnospiraceae bacterium]
MSEMELEAKRELLDNVLLWMDEMIEPYDCPRRTFVQLHVCVEELYVNICNYAYGGKIGKVRLEGEVKQVNGKPVFSMTFIDQGVPFNPLEHIDPDITLSAEDRNIGGLGILMVKKRMDVFTYEYKDGSNVVTIEKALA